MANKFPSLAPCAYRRVYRGQTYCTRATDEFDRLVWPEVCARCPAPAWLEAGVCRHLDVGTEVGKNLGAQAPRVYTACRFFGVRLDGLERCGTCPEFVAWEGEEDSPATVQQVARSIPGEVIEEAVEEAVGRHMREAMPAMMPRCFRAGVEACVRSPRFSPRMILIMPPASLRQNEGYRMLVGDLLKQGSVQGLFFTSPLEDVDSLCDLCLSVQQCSHLVVDLGEWDRAALFAMGLARALGREILMIRGDDPTPPFVPQGLPVFEYDTAERLGVLLVQGLGLTLPPSLEGSTGKEEQAPALPGEAADEDQPAAEPTAAKKKTRKTRAPRSRSSSKTP